MAARDNKRLLLRWIDEMYNKHDASLCEQMVTDPYVRHDVNHTWTPTPAEFAATQQEIFDEYPDFHVELDDMIAEGDKVFIRASLYGTHKDTGDELYGAVNQLYRIEDGKLAETWAAMRVNDLATWD